MTRLNVKVWVRVWMLSVWGVLVLKVPKRRKKEVKKHLGESEF